MVVLALGANMVRDLDVSSSEVLLAHSRGNKTLNSISSFQNVGVVEVKYALLPVSIFFAWISAEFL